MMTVGCLRLVIYQQQQLEVLENCSFNNSKGQSPSAGQDAVTDQISTAFDICELEQAQYSISQYQVSDWKLRTRGKCDP
jgi:hypothetical protein